MTQKKLNYALEMILSDDIIWHTIADKDSVQTIVRIHDEEFEIARRPLNRQTLIEGSDFHLITSADTLDDIGAILLTSILNHIYDIMDVKNEK